jgi:hypothetical protein
MRTEFRVPSFLTRYRPPLLMIAAACLLGAVPARASLILAVQSVAVNPGTSGDGFDVTLQNTGGSPVTIGGFSFGLSISNVSLTFTGANMSTTPTYAFLGDSFDAIHSFSLVINLTSQSVLASDLSNSGAGDVVGAGATVGLGHIIFSVAGNAAAGPSTVTLGAFPASSLSNPSGGNLAIVLSNGTITINSVAGVPEPSTWTLIGLGMPALLLARRRRRFYLRREITGR